MRSFEFEAREIVRRAGVPVTDFGFTRDAVEAGGIAARIGGPVVVKSQVLTTTGPPIRAAIPPASTASRVNPKSVTGTPARLTISRASNSKNRICLLLVSQSCAGRWRPSPASPPACAGLADKEETDAVL